MQSTPPLSYLPAEWATDRVFVRDSSLADVPILTETFNTCQYVAEWDPNFQLVEESVIAELVSNSLATSGPSDGFRLQVLGSLADQRVIGYFHVHHCSPNLPQTATTFISMFFISPAYQKQGFAQEVVAGLTAQLAQLGYVAVWLEVFLKNWPALRFWVQQGFTRIIEYDGDIEHSAKTHATLALEKRLSG